MSIFQSNGILLTPPCEVLSSLLAPLMVVHRFLQTPPGVKERSLATGKKVAKAKATQI